jgi:hypothetical protein
MFTGGGLPTTAEKLRAGKPVGGQFPLAFRKADLGGGRFRIQLRQ